MANGHVPPKYILSNSDYQIIDSGTLISRGTYAGCIQILGTYYWVSAPDSGSYWDLNNGTPDGTIVKITSTVWNACKAGGSYDWVIKDKWWNDSVGGEDYRWADDSGTVVLSEV